MMCSVGVNVAVPNIYYLLSKVVDFCTCLYIGFFVRAEPVPAHRVFHGTKTITFHGGFMNRPYFALNICRRLHLFLIFNAL